MLRCRQRPALRRHRSMPLTRRVLCCLLVAAVSACGPQAAPTPPFAVARISPEPAAGPLLLNDALTVYFAAPVNPLSVTADSFTVVDDRGHRVPGTLRSGVDWVSFQPLPPVLPALDDGSFLPGASYELRIAGSPRPDAVRASDGRRLASPFVMPFRAAQRDEAPPGLAAPLRPPANDLPFLLRPVEGIPQVPADAPRLLLAFTQPLLPSSVGPSAFAVTLLDQPPFTALAARSVRIVPPRLPLANGETAGTTVEIDLGAEPRRADGSGVRLLQPGDRLCVQLVRGGTGVRDYRGAEPLLSPPVLWSVVAGAELACAEWPLPDDVLAAADRVEPGFEIRAGRLQPCLRRECGDGRLGVLRPARDVVLRPGEPFDRGDGVLVASDGPRFGFLAIDVPDGVTVQIEPGTAGAIVQAVGGIRVAGRIVVRALPRVVTARRFHAPPVLELADQVPVAFVAAGPVAIAGEVVAEPPPVGDATSVMFASASHIDLRGLRGELPFRTVLAVDEARAAERPAVLGVRGQSVVAPSVFSYGLPPDASCTIEAELPWRQMPADRSAALVQVSGADGRLAAWWQSAPADPLRATQPDLTNGRIGRRQACRSGDAIAFPPGDFVRVALRAQVAGGEPTLAVLVRLVAR
jgi:hypothetical protein